METQYSAGECAATEGASGPPKAQMEPDTGLQNPEFVVAIDFGTTYSKAAYAVSPHLETGHLDLEKKVHLITEWPYQENGGGVKNSKTRSCLWYMPGPKPETFELKFWGWEAFVRYRTHVEELAQMSVVGSKSRGYLLQNFKLGLYPGASMEEGLPKGLSHQRVISDFLEQMGQHILLELQMKYGSEVSHKQIKWCITVPAVWDDWARQEMETCAEMAGLVQGPSCQAKHINHASGHDLVTVVEPEAASIYCHNTLKKLWDGDVCIVVDLGGGTTDLVTHKTVGSTTRSNVRVKEVDPSIGSRHGGAHLDDGFLAHMRRKMYLPGYSSFQDFEGLYPAQVLDLLLTWGRIKTCFEGDEQEYFRVDIPLKLGKFMKRQRKQYAASVFSEEEEDMTDYSQIKLRSDTVRFIFDGQIGPILRLIEQRITSKVDFILVVGGFSESPYVRKRIMERFNQLSGSGPSVIFPRNSDTAVVRGAVALGFRGEWESYIKSRIAKRTYGFDTTVPFENNVHPLEYKIQERGKLEPLCDHIFQTFITKGQEVSFDDTVEFDTYPLYREGFRDAHDIKISIYSTSASTARYVLDNGVRLEASCTIHVSRRITTGSEPKLGIRIQFGGTRIRLVVWGLNFRGEKIAMPPVRLTCFSQSSDDYEGDDERPQKGGRPTRGGALVRSTAGPSDPIRRGTRLPQL